MLAVACFRLVLSASLFLLAVNAQTPRYNQEVIDAIQNRDIQMLQTRSEDNRTAITQVLQEQAQLRSAMDRFVGIGIGFGATLTLLQIAQLAFQVKRSRLSDRN